MADTRIPAGRRDHSVPAAVSESRLESAPRRRRRGRWLFDNKILPWLLLLPALITIFGLVLRPLIGAFWLSFHSAGIGWLRDGSAEWVGLGNYVRIMTEPLFQRVIITTGIFGIACVTGTMIVGLAVALLLNQPFVGRRAVAVIALVPWAIAGVAAGRIWSWLFDARYGVINYLLSQLPGVEMIGFAWFNTRWTAFLAIGLVVVWQSYPFVAIALLAGFQSISPEVIEAARVDGAGPWQRLRHITLPILKPLVMVLVIISTIWDFRVFDQVFVMTGGGPARSTEVIAITTIAEGFGRRQFGLGAALAVTLFGILMAITLFYIRMIREDEGL